MYCELKKNGFEERNIQWNQYNKSYNNRKQSYFSPLFCYTHYSKY